MAKPKVQIPVIEEAIKTFSKEKLLSVYMFFGPDTYSIDSVLSELEKAIEPLIVSDFDREVVYGEEKSALDIINLASSFPFGSEKKLIVVKGFDTLKDKKNLVSYINNPSPFTVLVLLGGSESSVSESEPYKSLKQNGFIFEAKELKGGRVLDWVIHFAAQKGKTLDRTNAQYLIDISGEKRDVLEAQIEKMLLYLKDKNIIDFETIRALSSSLKEYNIFDLQNALGRKDAAASLKVAFNLLEKGMDISQILYMLTRYFTGLSRIKELTDTKVDEYTSARIVGTHPFYYREYVQAKKLYSDKDLLTSVRALLQADVEVKTTSTDSKSIITTLISKLLGNSDI